MTRYVLPLVFLLMLCGCAPSGSHDDVHTVRHPDTQFLEPAVRDALNAARMRFEASDQKGADAAQAFGELGKHYLAHHLNDGAVDCFDAARALAPENATWHYYYAQASAALGATDLAIAAMSRVLARNPRDAQANYWLGRWHLDQAQIAAATSYIATALGLAGSSAVQEGAVAALAGELALREGRYADADRFFSTALQRQPAATRLYYPLVRARRDADEQTLSAMLARAGDGEVRVDDPRMSALSDYSLSTQMLLEQGGMLLAEKRFADAAKVFLEATVRNPQDVYAWTSLGRTREVLGQVAAARQALGRALELDDQAATAHLFMGMLNERQGDDQAAVLAYQRALQSDPQNERPRLLLAHALLRTGRPDEAAAAYAQVARQRPGNLLARYYLALIHLSLAQCSDAAPVLAQAEQLKANYGPLLEVRARYNAVCDANPATLSAARDISQLLSNARPDARSAVTRALVMHASGDAAAARAAVAQALTLAAGTALETEIRAHLSDDGAAATAWLPGSSDLMPPRLGPDSLR